MTISRTALTLVSCAALFGCSAMEDPAASSSVARSLAKWVIVSPAAPTIAPGTSLALNVELQDASGRVVTGQPEEWSTSDSTIATVSGTGVVTAHALGVAKIYITSGMQSAYADVSVSTAAPAPRWVSVSPATAQVSVRSTMELFASVTDAQGHSGDGRAGHLDEYESGARVGRCERGDYRHRARLREHLRACGKQPGGFAGARHRCEHVDRAAADVANDADVTGAATATSAATALTTALERIAVQRLQCNVAALAAHPHDDDGLLLLLDHGRAYVGGSALRLRHVGNGKRLACGKYVCRTPSVRARVDHHHSRSNESRQRAVRVLQGHEDVVRRASVVLARERVPAQGGSGARFRGSHRHQYLVVCALDHQSRR